ncbi:MAG: ribosome maturation factor RimM [Bacteroidia bacterium]|nr:MAG: ribosome maturation factor RimM [Bacteroidia bacterium]
MDELVKAGKIGKPHGIKGEVTLHLYVEADLEQTTSVFLETADRPCALSCGTYTRFLPNKTIVKLKSISSVNDAKKLTNKNIFLNKQCIIETEHLKWMGFSVIDVNKNMVIGKITDWIVQNNLEWIVVSTQDNREILLPLNEVLIEKIDEANQVIFYKAVEGMY